MAIIVIFAAKVCNIFDTSKFLSYKFYIMEEKIIQKRLKAVCEALGISDRKFAISIGKSGGYINSLRKTKGDGIPSDILSKISEVYPTVNRDYLLEGVGDPLNDETDTLSQFPNGHQPEPDNYKELCMAYRQDLADAREEIKKLREAYFQLLETSNKLLSDYAALQALCIKEGVPHTYRDDYETKKA